MSMDGWQSGANDDIDICPSGGDPDGDNYERPGEKSSGGNAKEIPDTFLDKYGCLIFTPLVLAVVALVIYLFYYAIFCAATYTLLISLIVIVFLVVNTISTLDF